MKPDEMLKIYDKQESEIKKKSAPKKKSRARKTVKKPEIEKEDDLRTSEPMKNFKDPTPQIENKSHQSEKKL